MACPSRSGEVRCLLGWLEWLELEGIIEARSDSTGTSQFLVRTALRMGYETVTWGRQLLPNPKKYVRPSQIILETDDTKCAGWDCSWYHRETCGMAIFNNQMQAKILLEAK